MGYGFHEDGFASAVRAASQLAPSRLDSGATAPAQPDRVKYAHAGNCQSMNKPIQSWLTPAVCIGDVMHARTRPIRNVFHYPIFYLRLPSVSFQP